MSDMRRYADDAIADDRGESRAGVIAPSYYLLSNWITLWQDRSFVLMDPRTRPFRYGPDLRSWKRAGDGNRARDLSLGSPSRALS